MGLSQAEVCRQMAARTGLPYQQQTLTRIENGEQAPQLGEAVELAEIVGADLIAMTRPPGLARQAWQLLAAARNAREAHADLADAARRLTDAREAAEHFISKAEADGNAAELADEIAVGRRALKDTED
jgi:transcriptional regulator with XRE-family HTH domain